MVEVSYRTLAAKALPRKDHILEAYAAKDLSALAITRRVHQSYLAEVQQLSLGSTCHSNFEPGLPQFYQTLRFFDKIVCLYSWSLLSKRIVFNLNINACRLDQFNFAFNLFGFRSQWLILI